MSGPIRSLMGWKSTVKHCSRLKCEGGDCGRSKDQLGLPSGFWRAQKLYPLKKNQSWCLCRFIYIQFLYRGQKKKQIVQGRNCITFFFFTSKDLRRFSCLCGGNNKSLVYNTCRGQHPKTPINLYHQPNSTESLSGFIEAICRHRFQSSHS